MHKPIGIAYINDCMYVHRTRDEDTSSTTTTTSTAVAGIAATGAQVIPCLLIRTELCGKTLKQWLEDHKKRRRRRVFNYFGQVSMKISKVLCSYHYT